MDGREEGDNINILLSRRGIETEPTYLFMLHLSTSFSTLRVLERVLAVTLPAWLEFV